MKIGIITNCMDGQLTGFGRYTRNFVKHLIEMDKDVHLIHNIKTTDPLYSMGKEILLPDASSQRGRAFLPPLFLRKFDLDIIHYPVQFLPSLEFQTSK